MVKTYESRIPPSSNLSKVIISFDKFDQYLPISSITCSLYNKQNDLRYTRLTWISLP